MRDIEFKKKRRGTTPDGPRLWHYLLLGTLVMVAVGITGYSLLR